MTGNYVLASLADLVHYAWMAAVPEKYADEVARDVVRELQAAQKELANRLEGARTEAQRELIDRYGRHDAHRRMDSVAGNVVGTLTSMAHLHMMLARWSHLQGALPLTDPQLWKQTVPRDGLTDKIAGEWRKIADINYLPLSEMAADMLEDPELAPQLGSTLAKIHDTLQRYIDEGISATTNVVAEIWQSLIPDRDQRAAYYTKPPVAALLAGLTAERIADPRNARYNEICAGTGTLARAVEERLRFRYFARAEDKTSIHAERMQSRIQLTDINPQSVSVATANLSSMEPQTIFTDTTIYAITSEGGSLNFLKPLGVSNMEDALIGGHGSTKAMLILQPGSADIICNNDPYFRSRGGAPDAIPSEAKAAYRAQANRRLPGVVNWQAGLATPMHVIEHVLLADGAPHGKVLPLTAAHAESWSGFRRNIENEYTDVIAICTAAGDGASMSADTSIQEMLLVGTKTKQGDKAVTCVNLTRTFKSKLEAKMFADAIRREIALGETSGIVRVGGVAGTYFRMSGLGEGKPWHALGLSGDYASLTSFLMGGNAWDPATGKAIPFALPMTTLSGVSAHGPTHHLLGSLPVSRDARGAFAMHPTPNASSRLNPSLWEMRAGEQTRITCNPTHYGVPRAEPKEAERMLETAGRYHLARNLAMSAQTIAVAYTEPLCMGGRSWTTLYADAGVAEAIALFLNSTFGMVIRIGYGQLTTLGRSAIQVRAIAGHPIPDFSEDSDAGRVACQIASENFERLRALPLKRIAWSALDENRKDIDRVVARMLGLSYDAATERMLQSWREMMCLQPVVHGNNRQVVDELRYAGVFNDNAQPRTQVEAQQAELRLID